MEPTVEPAVSASKRHSHQRAHPQAVQGGKCKHLGYLVRAGVFVLRSDSQGWFEASLSCSLAGRAADSLPDQVLSADRGKHQAALPRLLSPQRHSGCIFPRMHRQTIRLIGERLWEARL